LRGDIKHPHNPSWPKVRYTNHMKPTKISNIFSQEELDNLLLTTEQSEKTIDDFLGRQRSLFLDSSKYPLDKLESISYQAYGSSLVLNDITYVEYNGKFGTPMLPPHFDGDFSELIINFQLSTNTVWQIGVDLELFTLEDNSAVLFHPNETAHWRPHKTFNDGEYVKMIFFRYTANPPKDYSHMRLSIDDPQFKDINQLRDSFK